MTYLEWLTDECGYRYARDLHNGRWAAVESLLFTGSLIVGRLGDMVGIDDRWCYRDVAAAKAALDAWDGNGEPTGWHRNPKTGRRRPDGDELLEYINP